MTEVNEISGADASELMELAMAGKLETSESTDSGSDVEEVPAESEDVKVEESEEIIEDTENESGSEEESDTEEQIDGDAQEDTDESEEETGDSTAQDMEESGSEEENEEVKTDDAGDEPEEKVEADENEPEDGTDKDIEESSDDPDGEQPENNDIDIEEYNRLKDFHERLTKTEFKVNGRNKTGFTEVEDLIKAQQAYGGLEKKFQAVKDIQPFMKSMIDNGFVADPAKYELSVRAGNGDIEAMKQIMRDKGIDPLTIDLEDEGSYVAKGNELTRSEELAYGAAKEVADNLGVTKQLEDVLFTEFDDASRAELFKDDASIKANTIALAEQIENGLYDEVMNEVDKLSIRDNKFAHLTKLDQYNQAAKIVNAKNNAAFDANQKAAEADAKTKAEAAKAKKANAVKVKAEKAKIETARKEKEYEAKAKEQEKKVAADRSKASQASKPKPGKTTQTKKSSPLDLPSDEFANFWDGLLALNDR